MKPSDASDGQAASDIGDHDRMRVTGTRALLGGLGVLLLVAGPRAQQPAQPPPDRPTFRAEVSLVEVSAVVTGAGDRPVVDLTKDDFEILEDGVRRPVASARFLSAVSSTTPPPLPASLAGARVDEVVTNRDLADAPAFVLLMDDLNVSPYDAHRAIRAGLGLLGAIPKNALVSVVDTSGEGGALITLGRPNQDHEARVRAFRGRLVLVGPSLANPFENATKASSVDAPCGVGSDVANSPDCSDPTRAARRARALQVIGELFSRTGSRRKVLVWLTTDMGVSPLAPESNREAQFAGLQRLLGGDVTVYAIDPRGNTGSFVAGGGGLGQGDRRTGGRMRVGPADTQFGGRGGSTVTLNTDDMVGVPLTQLARETGGRWIQSADNVERVAAEVVTQSLSSYVLAYESGVSKVEGRHSIEVKVRRRGVKVSARRAFVVAPGDRAEPPPASTDIATARLREVIRGGVPFGSLALKVHVAPQFAVEGPARALVTMRVDEDTATDASTIDLLVLAADDRGKVGSIERFAMSRPSPGVPWEGSITITLERGQYQLRIAASTQDGARTGLLLHPIDMRPPAGNLLLGVPTLLGEDEHGVRPTLARSFPTGHPLAYQVEVAGASVRRGTAAVRARLVDAAGADMRAEAASTEPAGSPAQLRATGVIQTTGMAPGAYTLVVEAVPEPGGRAATHAIPVRLDVASAGPAGARLATSAPTAPRDLTPLVVAHGPLTRHGQHGPLVIRSERDWKAFWLSLPTRQAAPDIDFARVTLIALVSDDVVARPGAPRIRRVQTEPGGVVVQWTTSPDADAASPVSSDPVRPFLVVGLPGHQGGVRFEKVE